MIVPVQKNRVYENVSAQIRDQIEQGAWKEGDRIQSEMKLAELFHVSRGSIREAIKSLQMAGIVEAHSGQGTFVAPNALQKIRDGRLADMLSSTEYLDDVLQCRYVIGSYTTRGACQICTPEDIAHLRENFQQMMVCEGKKDHHGLDHCGIEFHAYIVGMLKNEVLSALYNSLTQPLMEERNEFSSADKNSELYYEGHMDHKRLIDAFEAHDTQKAEEIIKRHLFRKLRDKKEPGTEEEIRP